MSKNNKTDFFGIKKSPNYLGGKSKNSKRNKGISFLTSKKPINLNNKPRKNSRVKSFGFLNKGKVMPKQKYVNWNYKQIKKRFPGLNPYGDADMDGSMNYKDCKPFDASKDANVIEKIKGIFSRKKKEFAVETKEEKTLREVGTKIKAARRKQRLKAFVSGASSGRPIRKLLIKKTKKGELPRKFNGATKTIRGATQLAGIPASFPRKAKSRKGESVHARAGRPSGSYKYSIPGKGPVPIHVYKKWLAEQKAKARIEALARLTAIQSGQQAPIDGEEQVQEVPTEEVVPTELEESQPAEVQPTQFTPEQIRQIQMQRAQQQQQVQQQGAPRGRLDFSRGGISDSRGNNILNAPNFARGELTNVGEKDLIKMSERPQTNPRGEIYTQIDPMSGRPIVNRRISEKFATGEAL